jgi:hypothetical protein
MEKKPEPEQCVAGICEACENFCNSMKCPSTKDLSDTEAVLMIFFRKGSKCRIHLVGNVSIENIAQACATAVIEASKPNETETPKYAA